MLGNRRRATPRCNWSGVQPRDSIAAVRLGTCIAMEILTGAAVMAAIAAAAIWGVIAASDDAVLVARAASLRLAPPTTPVTSVSVGELPVELARNLPTFHGERDDVLLEPLRSGTPARVKFNTGGSSISLRVDFTNGARAAFKPLQTNLQSVPRKDVAAYRINLLLGLHAVQPAIGGRLAFEELFAVLDPDSAFAAPRMREEIVADEEGMVAGSLSWWIPVIRNAKVGGFDIDSTEGVVTWKRLLAVGSELPAADAALLAQISNMVVFDFLINNADRWTGGNARMSEDGKVLYFMDNSLSFGVQPDGHKKSRIYLDRVQTFSRRLVTRLRDLRPEMVHEVVSEDVEPFEVLLTDSEIAAIIARRDHLLRYVDLLIAEHGEAAVLVFP